MHGDLNWRLRQVLSALAVYCSGLTSVFAGIPEPPLVLYGLVTDVNGARLTTGEISFTLTPAFGGAPISVTTNLSDIDQQFSFVAVVPCESAAGGSPVSADYLQLRAESTSRASVAATLNGVALVPRTLGDQALSTSVAGRGALVRLNMSTVEYIDSDNDGLLDAWERRHFGGLQQGPGDDPDGDGRSNLMEQMFGTDPGTATSQSAFLEVSLLANGNFKVTWSTKAGRKYRLLKSTEITLPRALWTPIPDDLTSGGVTTLSREIPRDASTTATFFVVVELAP